MTSRLEHLGVILSLSRHSFERTRTLWHGCRKVGTRRAWAELCLHSQNCAFNHRAEQAPRPHSGPMRRGLHFGLVQSEVCGTPSLHIHLEELRSNSLSESGLERVVYTLFRREPLESHHACFGFHTLLLVSAPCAMLHAIWKIMRSRPLVVSRALCFPARCLRPTGPQTSVLAREAGGGTRRARSLCVRMRGAASAFRSFGSCVCTPDIVDSLVRGAEAACEIWMKRGPRAALGRRCWRASFMA